MAVADQQRLAFDALCTRDDQRDATDQRADAGDRGDRHTVLLVRVHLQRPQVDDSLATGVAESAERQDQNTDDDKTDADELHGSSVEFLCTSHAVEASVSAPPGSCDTRTVPCRRTTFTSSFARPDRSAKRPSPRPCRPCRPTKRRSSPGFTSRVTRATTRPRTRCCARCCRATRIGALRAGGSKRRRKASHIWRTTTGPRLSSASRTRTGWWRVPSHPAVTSASMSSPSSVT